MLLISGCDSDPASSPADVSALPTFVGSSSCQSCHETEYEGWRASHHAQAMQPANLQTVRGDFSNARVLHFGETSEFVTRAGMPFVRTLNTRGDLQDFPVRYTFGIYPLQQYLVEAPGGRLQALPFAWDSRSPGDGGQRWFHLYPDEQILAGDPLHWAGPQQNWNFMCAECHSTQLEKNYDTDSDTFATTWAELNVGCEACHGPGSRHLREAAAGQFSTRRGLVALLDDTGRAVWQFNPATGIAERSESRLRPPSQPEACGRCHSRRSMISSDYVYGKPLLDTHLPALLDEGLYFPDGQVQDEVFVYGSFLQSRMYQAGVSCSDCHEPHTAALHSAGAPSDVCAACHLPARFASREHHQHDPQVVACVDCHMPARNFMQVDLRRDHSFRIPRPELSDAVGAPDACTACHADEAPSFAAAAIVAWYGAPEQTHYGYAIDAGRRGRGNNVLLPALRDRSYPGIVRATLLTLLRPPYARDDAEAIRDALGDADGLIRLGALRALPGLESELQVELASPMLSDALRAVRIEALRIVSPWRNLLHDRFRQDFADAQAEYIDAQAAIAERPEAHLNLGNLYLDEGNAARSEAEFRVALQLDERHVGARANLADLYRRVGRDTDAEQLLREGLALRPGEPTWQHALGLLLVRSGRAAEGLSVLREASGASPDNARYLYVYAVALNSLDQADLAIDVLRNALGRFPGDFDIAWALATILRDAGLRDEAREVAGALAVRFPGVQPVQALLLSLQ